MKILLSVPGHLKTVPMNGYVFRTLTEMGHEVRVFDFGACGIYPRLLKKVSLERFLSHINNRLKKAVQDFRPDMFLTIFGFDHSREVLEHIRDKGVVTACWWLNDPFQFTRSLKNAGSYEYYFTNARGCLSDYRNEGVKNVYYLPVGCYPPVHRKYADRAERYEICFVGDWGPVREQVLESIAVDFNLSIFGPWKKKIRGGSPLRGCIVEDGFFSPESMVEIFNQSRIVLNIHSWFGRWQYGTNPRLFEAGGCGTFQLCDWKEEIPDLFVEDKEIVLYRSIDELKEKIAYFLKDGAGRSEIAGNAYLRAQSEHTYEARLKEMLYICRFDKQKPNVIKNSVELCHSDLQIWECRG